MTGPSICLKTNQSNENSLKNTSKKQQLVTSSIYILPNGAVKVDTGKKIPVKRRLLWIYQELSTLGVGHGQF